MARAGRPSRCGTATTRALGLAAVMYCAHSGSWAAFSCIARKASGTGVAEVPTVRLYQFESCPFCSKVRAYCDYNNVNVEKIEVNPVTKAEIQGVAGDYKKVPIADISGEVVTGSADIIRKLADTMGKSDSTSVGDWGTWVDDTLVKTLPPNVYRTPGESLQIAGKVAESFDFVQALVAKYFGGAAMFFVSKMMAKKAGIAEGQEREALYAACKRWTEALGDRSFLGGEAPSMADLEVFGVLASVEGTDTHEDMLANTGISGWYRRMRSACGRA